MTVGAGGRSGDASRSGGATGATRGRAGATDGRPANASVARPVTPTTGIRSMLEPRIPPTSRARDPSGATGTRGGSGDFRSRVGGTGGFATVGDGASTLADERGVSDWRGAGTGASTSGNDCVAGGAAVDPSGGRNDSHKLARPATRLKQRASAPAAAAQGNTAGCGGDGFAGGEGTSCGTAGAESTRSGKGSAGNASSASLSGSAAGFWVGAMPSLGNVSRSSFASTTLVLRSFMGPGSRGSQRNREMTGLGGPG